MREERVTLSNIDAERLIKAAKDHLQELGLKIINEDAFEGYHSIKAHKDGDSLAYFQTTRSFWNEIDKRFP